MNACEFQLVDNLLKEVAGGLPYEAAKEELEAIVESSGDDCPEHKPRHEHKFKKGLAP